MKLVLNPIIEERLHAAFPKPANSAGKGLAKYVGLLEQLLTAAEVRGRDNFEVMFHLYSIPTTKLSADGGQIGPKKIRIHKWLADNGLSLIEITTAGNNISKRVSKVKLTNLVTIADAIDAVEGIEIRSGSACMNNISPSFKWTPAGCQRCRVIHGGERRLRRTQSRGG